MFNTSGTIFSSSDKEMLNFGLFSYLVLFLLVLSLLFWILYSIRTMKNYRSIPSLLKPPIDSSFKSLPFVSVIIPTRNEAYRIEDCIKSLKAQTYPTLEILIVDDSTDNTIGVIKNIVGNDKRFKIIREEKLSGGWVGKPHAMQQGSKEAKGEWLLFVDADTAHDPEIVTSSVTHAIKNKLDMLSLLSYLVCKSFWEKIIQPVLTGLIIFISPLGETNDPKSKFAFALGPFILIKRSVFNKVGGYETIKDRIADDVEMAKLVKESGFKIGLAHAQDMMRLRMYERFREIWEGWSKNIFLGLVQKRGIRSKALQVLIVLIGLFGVFDMVVLPFLAFVLSGFIYLLTHSLPWLYVSFFSFLVWLLATLIQFYIHSRYGIGKPKYSPLYFLGGIITMGIFLNSAIKTLSGSGVTWKGRKYSDKTS